MPTHHAKITQLVLVTLLVVASCDGEAPSAYPLRAHGLTAHWCPESSEFTWALDFGLAPYELLHSEPLPWPGSHFYSVHGARSGAGGGGGMSFCCAPDGSTGCGVEPEQHLAKSWRFSGSASMPDVPHRLEVRLSSRPGHLPDRFLPGATVLDLRFDLGPPEVSRGAGCVRVPVRSVTEAEVSTEVR